MNAFLTKFNQDYVKVSSKVTNSFATKWLESYQNIYFKANCATSIQGLSTSIGMIKYNIELNLLRYLHENQIPEWQNQDKTSRVKFFLHKWDYQSQKRLRVEWNQLSVTTLLKITHIFRHGNQVIQLNHCPH